MPFDLAPLLGIVSLVLSAAIGFASHGPRPKRLPKLAEGAALVMLAAAVVAVAT